MARPRGEGHEGDVYRRGKEVVFLAEVQRQEIVFGHIAYSNFSRRRHGAMGEESEGVGSKTMPGNWLSPG